MGQAVSTGASNLAVSEVMRLLQQLVSAGTGVSRTYVSFLCIALLLLISYRYKEQPVAVEKKKK